MKILRIAMYAVVAALIFSLFYHFAALPERPMQDPASSTVGAVKIVKPVDCTGEWASEEKNGSRFVAHVKNGVIHVEMQVAGGFTGLWYGTFDIFQPGQSGLISKALNDPKYLVLSSADTKEFVYQDGSLAFDFSVAGTRTTVELKRVQG